MSSCGTQHPVRVGYYNSNPGTEWSWLYWISGTESTRYGWFTIEAKPNNLIFPTHLALIYPVVVGMSVKIQSLTKHFTGYLNFSDYKNSQKRHVIGKEG